MVSLVCPSCGRDDQVQKVTSIITSQSWSNGTSELSRYLITQVPRLPSTLAPWQILGMYGTGVVVPIGSIFVALFQPPNPMSLDPTPPSPASMLFIIVLMLAWAALSAVVGFWHWNKNVTKGAYKRKMQAYEKATTRWQNLYYCARDETIFVPGDGTQASLSEIKTYLYQ